MTYDPSDGTSLTELIRLIRNRLGDFPTWRKKTETGDGVETRYFLDDDVVTSSVTVTDDGVATTAWTMDYDTGWLTMTAALTGELIFRFQRTIWTDERITEAVNSGIDELFQWFTVVGENDELVTDGEAELLIETEAGDDLSRSDRITKVEWWTGSRWQRLDQWHVDVHGGKKYVVFENHPVAGITLRVSYLVAPGHLDSGSETLEGTAGLPARSKEPLVLFACSELIADRIHHRIRDDRAHNTQNENPVKSYEIQNDAQWLRAQAELKASRLRDERPPIRVRF